jgi:hypothetical protein
LERGRARDTAGVDTRRCPLAAAVALAALATVPEALGAPHELRAARASDHATRPAALGAPAGAPHELRAARASDHAARPAARTEWWRLRAVDRSSGASLELRIVRESNGIGGSLIAVDAQGRGQRAAIGVADLTAGPRRLEGHSALGRVGIRWTARALTLDVAGDEAVGKVRLRRLRRGPAALGWRLGTAQREDGPVPVTLNWAAPVATATARGTVTLPGGAPLELRGWRASYEHGWGSIGLSEPTWNFWDQYVMHGRRAGSAWLLHGLNRTDTVTGPGARDGQWLGVLARVGPRGLRICRARIHRRGWQHDLDGTAWPARLRASCRGLRLRLRDGTGDHDEYIPYREVRVRARGRGGLVGLGAHVVR